MNKRPLNVDFESLNKAKQETMLRQKTLLNHRNAKSQNLGRRLQSCSRRSRCLSAACFVCYREFRIHMIQEALALYHSCTGWKLATLIFYQDAMSDKELSRFDLQRLHQRLYKQLQRCGIQGPVFGSFEVDYHTEWGRWLPHYHLAVCGDRAALERLRSLMKRPRNMDARPGVRNRPLKVTAISDPVEQLSYLFKGFCKRVDGSRDPQGKRRTARPRRLESSQHALSLRLLDRWGFSKRMFLYGVRRKGPTWAPSLSISNRTETP